MPHMKKRAIQVKDVSTCKRIKSGNGESPVRRDLLERCYAKVTSLREHVLAALPSTSRLRRKKITFIGHSLEPSDAEVCLSDILDTTLVCAHQIQSGVQDTRWEQWLSFSQKPDESYDSTPDGIAASIFSQCEIVDFVVWLLFSRETRSGRRPKHLLCDGFRKKNDTADDAGCDIPGLFCLYPNSHVKALREAPWPQLLALLGRSGEKIMLNLLLDHSIFTVVKAGFQNYSQLSGIPISEHDLSANAARLEVKVPQSQPKPNNIILVRSRIFYAKPAFATTGLVRPGFKHIHVLNRCSLVPFSQDSGLTENSPEQKSLQWRNALHTVKVMMYMFPRQFGLHNVFTSQVDNTRTAQKLQDYTLREDEITRCFRDKVTKENSPLPKIPKRLRGQAEDLVRRLQIRHGRCSYNELLRHYCPSPFEEDPTIQQKGKYRTEIVKRRHGRSRNTLSSSSQARPFSRKHTSNQDPNTQELSTPWYKSVTDVATPPSKVSAFCRAVLVKIIPNGFWGEGDICAHNRAVFLRKVDHFIKLRRFESTSLHQISQDMKIIGIPWLQPPNLGDHKVSATDMNKRLEMFHEFLYFCFDSLLIPLLRSNFYVTESNVHRYQVFYFRHDTWRRIAEPSMAALKDQMFEEVKLEDATRILQSRKLGFSQIRLLPKDEKLRPIMNLRRRALTKGTSQVLGPSINSILGPVHSILKLEKAINPSNLGATLFSVGDIYTRLKCFKKTLKSNSGRLYFAKLDVQSAFDTIPQAAVTNLMASIPSQTQYTITKHAEVKPGERPVVQADKVATSAVRRWHATALAEGSSSSFSDRLESDLARTKKNTVFVDTAVQRTHTTRELLNLLNEHIGQNLVKVGKKYYRQKKGIPQGSVLSSFLCNYFYADLEARHLDFLDSPDCLLLRLIDDFLLITLDQSKAVRFVQVMHQGIPEYGVVVNLKKTLVNFDVSFRGEKLRQVEKNDGFPYCGTLINCQTLEISKDRNRDKHLDVSNSLTIDYGRAPGQNFQRKILNAFKIQSHLMFFDTSHNSSRTVIDSLHAAFRETASKMWAYCHCLPKAQQPSNSLIIRTISLVVDVAFQLLTGKSRAMRFPEYTCGVRKSQVALTGCIAFTEVLSRKQTKYHQVIKWLCNETERLGSGR